MAWFVQKIKTWLLFSSRVQATQSTCGCSLQCFHPPGEVSLDCGSFQTRGGELNDENMKFLVFYFSQGLDLDLEELQAVQTSPSCCSNMASQHRGVWHICNICAVKGRLEQPRCTRDWRRWSSGGGVGPGPGLRMWRSRFDVCCMNVKSNWRNEGGVKWCRPPIRRQRSAGRRSS